MTEVLKRARGRARAILLTARKVGFRQAAVALAREVLLAIGGAVLIAGGARVKILAPFTPVPFTLQTMSLHFLLFTLGRRAWRPVLAYIALGLAGLPFFAFGGGLLYVLSPTFGYILGFLLGTLLAGRLTPTGVLSLKKCLTAGFTQLAVIYLLGVTWLAGWYTLIRGLPLLSAFALAVATGLAPFIVWDIVKLFTAIPFARATVAVYLYLSERGASRHN